MNYKQFQADIMKVCEKHRIGLMTMVFGVAYMEKPGGDILGRSNTIIPMPPRDHEEEVLRTNTAKRIGDLVSELVENTYLGRDEE